MARLEDPVAERARQRRYWAKHKTTRNAYHRAYRKRKLADDREYAEKVRARARRAARTRRERFKARIYEAKNLPCVDCGVQLPPEIMDLDHVRGVKEFNVARCVTGAYGYISFARLEAELAKCDPRCPNCHRLRHYREGYANGND